MGKSKQQSKSQPTKDWRSQLKDFKATLPQGEEKASSSKNGHNSKSNGQNNPQRKKGPERLNQAIPHNDRVDFLIKFVYEFMAGYKHNSGIYINNLLRGRNYDDYVEAIFDSFTMDFFGEGMPNDFGDIALSFTVKKRMPCSHTQTILPL